MVAGADGGARPAPRQGGWSVKRWRHVYRDPLSVANGPMSLIQLYAICAESIPLHLATRHWWRGYRREATVAEMRFSLLSKSLHEDGAYFSHVGVRGFGLARPEVLVSWAPFPGHAGVPRQQFRLPSYLRLVQTPRKHAA